ncbi:MAG: hypothetical protein IPJ03_22470 [Ignavibacteriales bacterium]|nr:hypothetical protein [Ignavibacteriales bacterium]
MFKKFLLKRKLKKETLLKIEKLKKEKGVDPMIYSLMMSELMRELR